MTETLGMVVVLGHVPEELSNVCPESRSDEEDWVVGRFLEGVRGWMLVVSGEGDLVSWVEVVSDVLRVR